MTSVLSGVLDPKERPANIAFQRPGVVGTSAVRCQLIMVCCSCLQPPIQGICELGIIPAVRVQSCTTEYRGLNHDMVLRISRSSVIPPSDGMGWGWGCFGSCTAAVTVPHHASIRDTSCGEPPDVQSQDAQLPMITF